MDCLLINGYGFCKTRVGLTESLSSKMDDSAAREDACREYQSSLEDLTFNSKPHINMLTILAEENINFAKDIVEIIEAQISKAPSSEKLPVLYLVDSIVKNVGGEYLAVFAKNLIPSFICVFEKVDENTRKSLFKLRSTWDDVFPPKKLYALDVKVNSVDPAWPIKPLPPTVNASIHVNPKFLKQPEESSSSPRPTPAQPPPTPPPAPQPVPATISQSSLTQEQLIRQQLLAKQKQLLELQQKKIELELEQTKAQLAGGFTLPAATAVPTSSAASPAPKLISHPAPVVRPWVPPQSDSKPSVRDPRLNRPPTGPPPKDQPATTKREIPPTTGSHSLALEKARMQRKDVPQEKPKSKSPSPMAKSGPSKTKAVEAALQSKDGTKKDPRLRKRTQDKVGEAKDGELKEKKQCGDEKEREDAAREAEPQKFKGKLVNGSVAKHERDKATDKTAGNARTHARKRTRSRSRSRSPAGSPKRKERRSPKARARSSSSSPSPLHKAGKPRRLDLLHSKPGREDRPTPKNQSESRRSKRSREERHSETRDSHSPRSHDGGCKEVKDAPHRWRSGWEESKHMKLSDDMHAKPGPQRHKPHGTANRPSTPRTPKHRLSVDANLQIPDVLNSTSKKDLLRRASKRMESGEISREEFLNMAHQIKQLYQYQEAIQQHKDSWDESDFPVKKQPPLLSTPSSQPHPHEGMDAAELSYYEHKSKLRKTQVNHRAAGEEWEGEENPETTDKLGHSEKTSGGQSAGHPPPHKYNRAPRDRPGERQCEEPRPPLAPMVEEYNHGKEFPALKPGLRFPRRADHRETSEREWTSPLTERQHYTDREVQKSSYNVSRRYGPPADLRRPEVPPPSGTVVHRNSPSPAGLDAAAPRFERERLSPLQKDSADMSPIPCFESPNSEHSDDGPLDAPPPHAPTKSILKAPHARVGPQSSVRQHGGSPGHTPPHDGGHPPARYNGPGHMGSSRPHPPGWYEGSGGGPGRFDDSLQCEGPHHPAPGRFEGTGLPHHIMAERVDGPGHMTHGPMRGGERMGRFEGPPQGPSRFGTPVGLQTSVRFEVPGPGHSEGPLQRFEAPRHFNKMGPGPGAVAMGFQQRPMRFEGPGHFEGPGQPGPRYDVPHQGGPPHFENFSGQGHLRFEPQHNRQPTMRPMGPPMYDSPMAPQQTFPQRFPEPINPQFPAAPVAFPAQQNMQQAGNFHVQPFSQPGPAPFYNPTAPAVGLQQPVSVMGTMAPPFLPQTAVPFGQQNPQVVPPENHFGQVDVNDLLSKLLSTGIIKPSQPDAAPATNSESSSVPPPAPPPEEEEEEEQEVEGEGEEDVPDLTSFSIDDMKQRYESVVTKLYSGNQCCLCSMRFTAAQTDMYADHLDWHFRQNHAGKVASKKVTHRRWYYSLTDWIEFEEIADLEERAKSQFFEKENEEEVQKTQAAAKEKEFQSVRATKDQVGESCEICQEPFETYWVEEEEDWFLKNAIKVDDKNFHPSCFEDYKNTSSYLDVTPSPSKLLTDHPLGAFVKTEEKQEVTSCAVAAAAAAATAAASVKQEVQSEGGEPPEVKTEAGEVAAP